MCRTVGPDRQNIIHAGPVDRQSFDVSRAQSKNGHLGQKKFNLVASVTNIIEVGDRKFWIIFRHRFHFSDRHIAVNKIGTRTLANASISIFGRVKCFELAHSGE
jgi:hypothetical protein